MATATKVLVRSPVATRRVRARAEHGAESPLRVSMYQDNKSTSDSEPASPEHALRKRRRNHVRHSRVGAKSVADATTIAEEGSSPERVDRGGGCSSQGGRTRGQLKIVNAEGRNRGGRTACGRRGGRRGRGRGRGFPGESPPQTRPSTPHGWENPEVEVADFTPPVLRQRRKNTAQEGEGAVGHRRRRALNFESGPIGSGANPNQGNGVPDHGNEGTVPTVVRTKILNHRDLYSPGHFPKDVFIPAKKLIGVPKKWSGVDRFLASVHSMYTNVATGEEIYRVNFAGTTGVVDIRAADCIDRSTRMALAEYRGIPALPSGGNSLQQNAVAATSDIDEEEGGGNDSGSDTFFEEFLAKCGIYPGDRLYKPKRKNGGVLESGPSQRQSATGVADNRTCGLVSSLAEEAKNFETTSKDGGHHTPVDTPSVAWSESDTGCWETESYRDWAWVLPL